MATNMATPRGNPGKYRITYLLDAGNDWIKPHLRASGLLAASDKFDVALNHDHESVANCHIVFILGYTRILGKDFLERNELNLVVHESDLPHGKGFAPVQWQVLEGKKRIPICLLEASEDVDAGDVLERDVFDLSGYELYHEIRTKQANATTGLIKKFLDRYPLVTRQPQSGSGSFYRRRRAEDGRLDATRSLESQFNLLRIGNNEAWPSFFEIDGKRYILKIYPAS